MFCMSLCNFLLCQLCFELELTETITASIQLWIWQIGQLLLSKPIWSSFPRNMKPSICMLHIPFVFPPSVRYIVDIFILCTIPFQSSNTATTQISRFSENSRYVFHCKQFYIVVRILSSSQRFIDAAIHPTKRVISNRFCLRNVSVFNRNVRTWLIQLSRHLSLMSFWLGAQNL